MIYINVHRADTYNMQAWSSIPVSSHFGDMDTTYTTTYKSSDYLNIDSK